MKDGDYRNDVQAEIDTLTSRYEVSILPQADIEKHVPDLMDLVRRYVGTEANVCGWGHVIAGTVTPEQVLKSGTIVVARRNKTMYCMTGWFFEEDERRVRFVSLALDRTLSGSEQRKALYAAWRVVVTAMHKRGYTVLYGKNFTSNVMKFVGSLLSERFRIALGDDPEHSGMVYAASDLGWAREGLESADIE